MHARIFSLFLSPSYHFPDSSSYARQESPSSATFFLRKCARESPFLHRLLLAVVILIINRQFSARDEKAAGEGGEEESWENVHMHSRRGFSYWRPVTAPHKATLSNIRRQLQRAVQESPLRKISRCILAGLTRRNRKGSTPLYAFSQRTLLCLSA